MNTKKLVVGTVTAAAVAVAAGATAAVAEGPTGFTASFSPASPATGTKVTVKLGGAELAAAEQGKQLVTLKFTAPVGLTVNPAGVKLVCTTAQAAAQACPPESKVGSGTALLNSPAVGDVPASVDLFLTQPAQAGDIAGVQFLASALGQKIAVPARVTRGSASTPVTLVAANIDKVFPLPITIKDLSLSFFSTNVVKTTVTKKVKKKVKVKGKTRTKIVTKKVVRNVNTSLLTTPGTCPAGGWTVLAGLAFKDGGAFNANTTVTCNPKP